MEVLVQARGSSSCGGSDRASAVRRRRGVVFIRAVVTASGRQRSAWLVRLASRWLSTVSSPREESFALGEGEQRVVEHVVGVRGRCGGWVRCSRLLLLGVLGGGRGPRGAAGGGARGPGGAQPVAVGAGGDDVGAEGEPVDDGGGQAGVGEGGAPFGEGGVGCARDGGSFLAFGDDLEEEFGAAGVEVDVAEFVDLCGYPHRSTYAEAATMPRKRRFGL